MYGKGVKGEVNFQYPGNPLDSSRDIRNWKLKFPIFPYLHQGVSGENSLIILFLGYCIFTFYLLIVAFYLLFATC